MTRASVLDPNTTMPIGPLAADQLSVPPEQGPRGHDERLPSIPGQDPAGRGEKHPIPTTERRPATRSREHLDLMSED